MDVFLHERFPSTVARWVQSLTWTRLLNDFRCERVLLATCYVRKKDSTVAIQRLSSAHVKQTTHTTAERRRLFWTRTTTSSAAAAPEASAQSTRSQIIKCHPLRSRCLSASASSSRTSSDRRTVVFGRCCRCVPFDNGPAGADAAAAADDAAIQRTNVERYGRRTDCSDGRMVALSSRRSHRALYSARRLKHCAFATYMHQAHVQWSTVRCTSQRQEPTGW